MLPNFFKWGHILSRLLRGQTASLLIVLSVIVPCLLPSVSLAEEVDLPLGDQVESLKQSVLELNRDMLILEEELLFPSNTQVSVFVSMDVGEFFQLDAVKLKIDNQLVASHLYTDHQIDALYRGGVQRLYIGNLKTGSHEVSAFFVGKGPGGREYTRGATTTLDKDQFGKALELKIVDSTAKLQPVFEIKEWQPF